MRRLIASVSAIRRLLMPASSALEVGLGLGAQAGEARMRAAPFNIVYEARP